MSIIPASRLSSADLSRLGNNLATPRRHSPRRRARRRLIDAVNRSLAIVGEQVQHLHRVPVAS